MFLENGMEYVGPSETVTDCSTSNFTPLYVQASCDSNCALQVMKSFLMLNVLHKHKHIIIRKYIFLIESISLGENGFSKSFFL